MSESEKERPTIKDNPTAWFEIDTNVMVFVTLMFVILLYIYAMYTYYITRKETESIFDELIKVDEKANAINKTGSDAFASIKNEHKVLLGGQAQIKSEIADIWRVLYMKKLITPEIENLLQRSN